MRVNQGNINMTKQIEQFNPEAEAVLTFVPAFQSSTFTVTGIGESLLPIAEAIEHSQPLVTETAPQAPVTPVQTQNQYIDMSELGSRQIARKKLTARFYDLTHRTNMYGLLVDRINEDRDVAFARGLGLISTTHCLKHEKAVSKLRGML
jgi:hypothetical protein